MLYITGKLCGKLAIGRWRKDHDMAISRIYVHNLDVSVWNFLRFRTICLCSWLSIQSICISEKILLFWLRVFWIFNRFVISRFSLGSMAIQMHIIFMCHCLLDCISRFWIKQWILCQALDELPSNAERMSVMICRTDRNRETSNSTEFTKVRNKQLFNENLKSFEYVDGEDGFTLI